MITASLGAERSSQGRRQINPLEFKAQKVRECYGATGNSEPAM